MVTYLAGWAEMPQAAWSPTAGARFGGWCCWGWTWAFCWLDTPCITGRLQFGISVALAIVLDREKVSCSGTANLATCINTGSTHMCPSHWQWLFLLWESRITDAFSVAKLLFHLMNKYWWRNQLSGIEARKQLKSQVFFTIHVGCVTVLGLPSVMSNWVNMFCQESLTDKKKVAKSS